MDVSVYDEHKRRKGCRREKAYKYSGGTLIFRRTQRPSSAHSVSPSAELRAPTPTTGYTTRPHIFLQDVSLSHPLWSARDSWALTRAVRYSGGRPRCFTFIRKLSVLPMWLTIWNLNIFASCGIVDARLSASCRELLFSAPPLGLRVWMNHREHDCKQRCRQHGSPISQAASNAFHLLLLEKLLLVLHDFDPFRARNSKSENATNLSLPIRFWRRYDHDRYMLGWSLCWPDVILSRCKQCVKKILRLLRLLRVEYE